MFGDNSEKFSIFYAPVFGLAHFLFGGEKMKRKIICFTVIIATLAALFCTAEVYAATAGDISAKLQTLQSQYPNGTNQSKFYNSKYNGETCYRDLSGYCSWQCVAWGCKVFDTLWGMSITKASHHRNGSDLYVGDVVRYNVNSSYDHTIVITNIIGDKVYYTDCNGLKSASRIRWDREPLTKADIQSKISKKLLNKHLNYSYGYITHCPNNSIRTLEKTADCADLGDNFWAKIVHPTTGFSVGKSSTGNVELIQSDENYNTYWHFAKQSDGTYYISAYGGGVMDVVNFGTSAGTNVSVGNFNGSTAQRWYFVKNGDRYTVKALCTETVLDVAYNHNIQMYTANGTDAQKFSVEKVTPFAGWITASNSDDILPIYSSQHTVFKFDAAGANYFSLSLEFPDGRFEEIYAGTEKTFSKQLPAGDYTVYVNGQNNLGWTWNMGKRHFRVVDGSTVLPSEGWIKINGGKPDALYTGENITFTFDAKDAFYYDLWLHKENAEREEIYAGFDRSISKALPAGKYRLVLSASNNIGWTYEFAQVEFTVTDKPHPVKCETEYNGRKYVLYDVPLTWHEAKEYCERQGGHLATVSDWDENEFIKSLIANGEQNGYWLGATDEADEGIWEWVTDEDFMFSDWYADNPNNTGGNEHYLEIRKDYGSLWNDDCDNKFYADVLAHQGFICEFENALPRTESTAVKTESGYVIETKFINISDGTAIIAAYKNGRLGFISKADVGSDVLQTVTNGSFEFVKIMIWDGFKPLTKAEKITL